MLRTYSTSIQGSVYSLLTFSGIWENCTAIDVMKPQKVKVLNVLKNRIAEDALN